MEHGSVARARALRRRQTAEETLLWEALRDRRFHGFKFRRQVPFGPYVLDFYCDELHLALELDSPSHILHARRDARRDHYLALRGITVLRLMNAEITAEGAPGLVRLEALMRTLHANRRK